MSLSRRSLLATVSATAAALALPGIARASARKLRLGHNNTTSSIFQAQAEAFAKAVASLSDGRLGIEIYPNSQIGNEQQMLKAVVDGTLDLSIAPVGVTNPYSTETSLFELPYLFKDVAAARAALAGSLGAYGSELLKPKRILNLGWSEVGMRNFTANKPIRSVADLKGLKIRVPLSQAILRTFEALGAAPETLPFVQLQEALRTGRFEAQENPIGVIVGGGLNKVQTHLSLTRHVYTPSLLALSADVAEEMAASDLELLRRAAKAGTAASQAYTENADRSGLASLRDGGMVIVEDVDHAGFQAAAAAATDALAASFGSESLRKIRGLVS
ncbi:Solute-binding protein [Methylobacterium crusticola]|uniref:Solute-binding protein n=1 Tax=Methylobacterium crusticola TaxID=1697972 RepID=A0ABQ4R0A7_9HYPH|nr:TRAP transporter substrate-binding protein [Methylobacterium crusticola]GJD50726.1 Solute-binding protein [Methylobacterium crusticola]